MARQLRLEYPGALYHITARGNVHQAIFLDDTDRAHFLTAFGHEILQQRWRCYAYCLMGNHYHLLIETPEPNLSHGMRRLNGNYTQRFNWRHRSHRVRNFPTTLVRRTHPEAYQTAVWLLRRAANEPLHTVAVRFGVSPSRISKIQTAIESMPLTQKQRRAMTECKVKQ